MRRRMIFLSPEQVSSIHQKLKEIYTPEFYEIHNLKSGGIFLVGINARGEHCIHKIYFRGDEEYSQGFGGSDFTFPLKDGAILTLQGPWHSNHTGFYAGTGIDLRDKVPTIIIIGNSETGEIIHREDAPVSGPYRRFLLLSKNLFAQDSKVKKLRVFVFTLDTVHEFNFTPESVNSALTDSND